MHSPSHARSRPLVDTVQAGVDVHITTVMLTLAAQNAYQYLVLLAGDGSDSFPSWFISSYSSSDFADALSWVRSSGRSIWLMGFPESVSPSLKDHANLTFTDLNTVKVPFPSLRVLLPPLSSSPGLEIT